MNSVETPINRLNSSHTDPVTHTPAYKEVSVHMTVLPEIGVSPLPRTNSRWGHPKPQRGVELSASGSGRTIASRDLNWCRSSREVRGN